MKQRTHAKDQAHAELVTDLIDQVLSGGLALDEALRRYPHLQGELEELVHLAMGLRSLQEPVPVESHHRVRAGVQERIQSTRAAHPPEAPAQTAPAASGAMNTAPGAE